MGNPIKGRARERRATTGVSRLGRAINNSPQRTKASGIRPDHPIGKPFFDTTRTTVPKRKAGGGQDSAKQVEVPNPNPPATSAPFSTPQRASQGLKGWSAEIHTK
jgi:hypothetical protein